MSRTIHNIFISVERKLNTRWTEYWDNQLKASVEVCEKFNFKLIGISHNSKIPVKGVIWTDRDLSYENAYILLKKKMNIGVNLLKSKLIVADIDEHIMPVGLEPFAMNRTLCVISPHGYHVYFYFDTPDIDNDFLINLADKLGGTSNMWRGGINKAQYVLLPLSCVDTKLYEWLYNGEPCRALGPSYKKGYLDEIGYPQLKLMKFSELLKEIQK
jgi:hypothetical protein